VDAHAPGIAGFDAADAAYFGGALLHGEQADAAARARGEADAVILHYYFERAGFARANFARAVDAQ
jgi:hypothetical protein